MIHNKYRETLFNESTGSSDVLYSHCSLQLQDIPYINRPHPAVPMTNAANLI